MHLGKVTQDVVNTIYAYLNLYVYEWVVTGKHVIYLPIRI
jgi:hypothetical protein